MLLNKWLIIIGLVIALTASSFDQANSQTKFDPAIGQPFSDQEWINYDGQRLKITDFQDSIVLVEFVGMTCVACQAFSGGEKKGGYGGVTPQEGLRSIEEYFSQHVGVSLFDSGIIFVQVLLYSLSMNAPTIDDAKQWAEHFGFDQRPRTYVVVSPESLIGPVSYGLIPGFALVDKNHVIRALSVGDNPKQNLYTEFLPTVAKVLEE